MKVKLGKILRAQCRKFRPM